MNTIEQRNLKAKQASDRAAAISDYRQEIMHPGVQFARSNRLQVLASRVVVINGRLVTKLLIDGSLQLGRGCRYWI